MRSDLMGAFDKAEKTFALIKKIEGEEKILNEYSVGYRPLHVEVREIQKAQARIKVETKKLKLDLRLMSKDPTQDAKRDKFNARLEDMAAESKHLTESIPAKWTSERKAFVKLKKAATKARRIYRRNVDDAYGAIIETSKVIASAGDLAALQGQFGNCLLYTSDAADE